MYPEEIEFLTSAPFWIGVGLLAVLFLVLRAIAKALLMYKYQQDPEDFFAWIERNQQRVRNDYDRPVKNDFNSLDGAPIGGGLDINGEYCGIDID